MTLKQKEEWVEYLMSSPSEAEVESRLSSLPKNEQEEVNEFLYSVFATGKVEKPSQFSE